MDIKRKLQIVEEAVKSISNHDDADSVVVLAALGKVTQVVAAEAAAVLARQHAAAEAAVGAG